MREDLTGRDRSRRHALAALAGISWRDQPELDDLPEDEFIAIVRAGWSTERREMARIRAIEGWRARHPDRAAVQDAILASEAPGACDRCGSEAAQLVMTNYRTGAHSWRCASCNSADRRRWRGESSGSPHSTPAA